MHRRPRKVEEGHCRGGHLLLVVLLLCLWSGLGPSLTAQTYGEKLISSPTQDQGAANLRAIGLDAFNRGAFEDAAVAWRQAFQVSAGNVEREIDLSILIAGAYKALGQYGEAQRILGSMLTRSQHPSLKPQLARLLSELGDVYAATGPKKTAYEYLALARQMAEDQVDTHLSSVVLNNLGNLFVSDNKYGEAAKAYEESLGKAEASKDGSMVVRALSNAALLANKTGNTGQAKNHADRAYAHIDRLAETHTTAFVLTNLGIVFSDLALKQDPFSQGAPARSVTTLRRALAIGEKIRDDRAISYSAGHLGQVYENQGDYQHALDLSRQAVFAAQKVHAPESLYLWQWQVGRLVRKTGDESGALQSYRNSVFTLQSIRQEMATCYGGTSLSFRQSVEPLYFEYVDLLLRSDARGRHESGHEAALLEARRAMESLKVAELRDYFQDDCVDVAQSKVTKLDEISKVAVVIYPIVLPDRVEMLVNLPSGLKKYSVPVSSAALTKEISSFRRKLEKCTTREFLPHAQRLYTWLLRPLEKDIGNSATDTLVFVPDGPLRTIPMAALHDGKEYLISKYSLAITPGLDLTDPTPIKRAGAKMLMAGLTEGVQGFPPLPYVSLEMERIQRSYNGTVLLNKGFSCSNIEKALRNQPFSMVHIASHGKFDSDVNKTFLLTFEDKLTMNNLNQYVGLFRFRQEPLELLTLSACETAAGDERAALGLAGVTIRAGARSAVATLWHVNDEASSLLVAEFYSQLATPSVSRAAALRRAQLKLINNLSYDHPGYWAPFLLINNWL